ncbi:RNA polymerase factor sigma-54 [Helicobacter monodelphidis]|uniref:RNA polymerase factor sigma-54 n=1 Tax=Helicobacter sp. 15-1451 TaxID=2004995 RepID=UPI000DCD6FAA|nr:RNA polymerase factor sigma-54 [Helicobacter sp. 15-1451]RAX58625.1 RNA polymerase factor sigma-54 [Helicobacter sp. 15-1451]
MKLRTSIQNKAKLSATLKSWLPILQSSIDDLESTLNEVTSDNPYVQIDNPRQNSLNTKTKREKTRSGSGISDSIERFCLAKKSLYEFLLEQIAAPLFPTPKSCKIAEMIIEDINDEGYFDGDMEQIAQDCGCSVEECEKVRKRFSYLEPPGIGACDIMESFLFQLEQAECSSEIYALCLEIVADLQNHAHFKKRVHYEEAMKVIQKFKNPPAIDYLASDREVIPEVFVLEEGGEIEVSINDTCYPTLIIEDSKVKSKDSYIRNKIKEAKDLVDALEMRKATLYKIGLMIVEYQYDFFKGGEIRPMKLKDLADEFNHAPSTISRAISGKYLECNRGIFSLKSFFATAIDEDTSNAAIKDFIADLVKNEDRKHPLSDMKLLQIVEGHFGITLVRRTITKYRKQLNIASSSERKKLYEISC